MCFSHGRFSLLKSLKYGVIKRLPSPPPLSFQRLVCPHYVLTGRNCAEKLHFFVLVPGYRDRQEKTEILVHQEETEQW